MSHVIRRLGPLMVAAVLMAACGGGSSSTAGSSTVIGFVSLDFTNTNSANLYRYLQADAAKRGWTMTSIDTHGNVDEANAAMQNFVTRKVKAIITEVYTSTSLSSGLAAAKQAGIPVISHGGGPAPTMAAWFDGGDTGNQIATRLTTDLGPKGAILEFVYHSGRPNLLREQALDLLTSTMPGVQVTKVPVPYPGFLDPATAATSGWLAAHPAGSQPLAIWGSWDGPCYGSITALKEAGRTDVKVYGFNADPETLKDIKAGTFTASLFYDLPSAAQSELDEIANIFAAGPAWQQAALQLPTDFVDKSTIDKFLADHPSAAGS